MVNFGGMFLWFYAISFVPLGKAVAIHFTLPLFLLVLAAIFLRERVGIRRITATLVGFGGALVILQPGSAEIGWPELLILGSAVLYAATVIFLKHMLRTETPLAVTFYTNAFIFLFCIPPAIWFWVGPNVDDIVPILVIGVTGTFAPFMYASALRMVDASIIAPTDFLRLPIAALVGLTLFNEVPDLWTIAGGLVIAGASAYIARRDAMARKARSPRNPTV